MTMMWLTTTILHDALYIFAQDSGTGYRATPESSSENP